MYNEKDLNYIIHTILQALSNISEKNYYGITTLVDVLRGGKNKKILSARLNDIKEYGKLNYINREELTIIIEWLISMHYILKTRHSKYPVLHPTYEGIHYNETLTTHKVRKLQALLKSNNQKYIKKIVSSKKIEKKLYIHL